MTSSAYQDLLKTQKEILELGMYCKKFNITKAELQDLASKKRYEEEKEEHDRRTKGVFYSSCTNWGNK